MIFPMIFALVPEISSINLQKRRKDKADFPPGKTRPKNKTGVIRKVTSSKAVTLLIRSRVRIITNQLSEKEMTIFASYKIGFY